MKNKRTKEKCIFVCENCGKDITHKPSNRRKFCDIQCCNDWKRKTRQGFKSETRHCKECKKQFDCKPCEKKAFCSSSCGAKSSNRNRALNHNEVFLKISDGCKKAYIEGKLTGLKKGIEFTKSKAKPLVHKVCPTCGNNFTIMKWQENAGIKKYCSKKCCQKRPGQGGYRPGSVRNFKSGWYNSPIAGKVWLDSSYEFVVAEYLDEKKYQWIRNTNGFPYIKKENGIEKDANYVPDFYIKSLDLWIETKGYFVENDQRKLDAFPHRIKLITKKTIYDKSEWGF